MFVLAGLVAGIMVTVIRVELPGVTIVGFADSAA
jgi:hypothetical protein